VEILLLDEQFSEPGSQCPEDGWLGPADETRCPVDGTPLVALADLTDSAIELALQQAAGLLEVRHDRDALNAHGGIAAVLRF
jgi:peptide subunit release factor 1 (eRF1)